MNDASYTTPRGATDKHCFIIAKEITVQAANEW